MKRSSIITIIFLVLLVFIIGGCTLNEDEQALVGLWGIDFSSYEESSEPGVNIYYDFQANGEVIMTAFTAVLGQYGNPLVPTHFDYKATSTNITMTGLYGMVAMDYEIESGPIDGEMTIKLLTMDIKLLPDEINNELNVGISIPLVRIIDYSEAKGAGNE